MTAVAVLSSIVGGLTVCLALLVRRVGWLASRVARLERLMGATSECPEEANLRARVEQLEQR